MRQAIEIGTLLKNATEGSEIKPVLLGHSHGGSLAQVAAISNGLKGVIFNSEPIGIAVKKAIDKRIGKEKRKIFAKQVIAFSIESDWLSGGLIDNLCRIGRDSGLPVPTVFGKGYRFPRVSRSWAENHMLFLHSFLRIID